MLILPGNLGRFPGTKITTDDPRDHLLQAAQRQGLHYFEAGFVSDWQDLVAGIGNWLLVRLIFGEFACSLIVLIGALATGSSGLFITGSLVGLAFLIVLEFCFVATLWHSVDFSPADHQQVLKSRGIVLPTELQLIVDGMSAEHRGMEADWPFWFTLEYLKNPLWKHRPVYVLSIRGLTLELIVALYPNPLPVPVED
jgi:hypothetical protein